MSDLKIDEKHIDATCRSLKGLIAFLAMELKALEDKETDIFMRYQSYARMHNFLAIADTTLQCNKEIFALGHDVQHEIFKTKEYIRFGWNEINIHENPFFIDDSNNDGAKKPAAKDQLNELLSRLSELKDLVEKH